ncbi:helix-turn-helix domain-containing protein [Candidatus Tisiphia endosymbiont of Hybos culiciformis]|uniref:helix-turn-helix domain-containing protein n=1 Tax=Candidatus Tisiphia endosymbiont of Hybos culiciformis TaxID=3139331 RepID=UPI003CCAC632
MFIVETIGRIRRMYHVDGKAIKKIARELNISKNTVKKVIRSDQTKFELAKYTKDKPVLGNHLAVLNQLLVENSKEPVRRRMTAKKLYQQLQISGYTGSYETVNLIVRAFRREREAKGQQVFIPLNFEPGESFQFDWGEEQFIAILQLVNKYGLDKVTNACNLAITIGGCSAKLVEQYLQPAIQVDINEYKFIQLKTPPDADCSSYSKIHL